MDYRRLGRSGLAVSPLCLGTMMFGGLTDEPTAARIIASAADAGVNFIDTADVYTGGRSEEIVGRAVADRRDWWVLATKVAQPTREDPNGRGASRRYVLGALEASLRRLNMSTVDLLYLHREDTATPLDETVRAIADLIRAGKIRYFGLSNYKAWRVALVCSMCDQEGIDRPVASQPLYNLLNRQIEVEHLPACDGLGVGVVPYSPLARGVLTGKYDPDTPPPEDSRAGRGDKRMMEAEWRPESLRVARALAGHAAEKGISAEHFSLAWVLANRRVQSVIAGPRTEAHWQSYLGALDVRLTPEDEAFVDGLVPPGHGSAHGATDPAYPVEGR